MIITFYENKYIPDDNQHLIAFPQLDEAKYPTENVTTKQGPDGIIISYGDEEVILDGATIRSDDVMICELNKEGLPARIYYANRGAA